MKLNNNDDSHNSGLNLLIYNMLLDIESHPAWVCGLKQTTTLAACMTLRHTLRGCIWIEALFTRWSSLWKNCKHSASCVFLFKLL
mgnify:CR=1 FL=1